MGYAYNRSGKKRKALETYRRVVTLKPGYLQARDNLAVALYENGRIEESLAEYQTLVSKYPECPEAHFNLGILHLAMKDKMAAVKQLSVLKSLSSTLETELYYAIHSDKILRIKAANGDFFR